MDTAGYVALTRQSGLVREMRIVANNVANMSTTGFKAEGVVFSEYLRSTGPGTPSVSMATANARRIVQEQGNLNRTGGIFDLAIDGKGYFLVQGETGDELTRAGHFTPDYAGRLVTDDGFPVLDIGGSPISVPLGGDPIAIAQDGTVSQQGRAIAQIGVVQPLDPIGMQRAGNTRFRTDSGWEPVDAPSIRQGFLEGSNVNGIAEVSRLIEVQRAYELGKTFMDKENDRIRSVIDTLGK